MPRVCVCLLAHKCAGDRARRGGCHQHQTPKSKVPYRDPVRAGVLRSGRTIRGKCATNRSRQSYRIAELPANLELILSFVPKAPSNVSITWEFFRNAGSWSPKEPGESEFALKQDPWYTLTTMSLSVHPPMDPGVVPVSLML